MNKHYLRTVGQRSRRTNKKDLKCLTKTQKTLLRAASSTHGAWALLETEIRGPDKVDVQPGRFEQKWLSRVPLETFKCFPICLCEVYERDKQRYVYAAWNGQKQ